MVTSRDVARLAGVSQATVSRVMSSSPNLSDSARERVLAAMDTLGYVPHAGAQAMKTRRSNTVGVVVADLTNPFYPEILDELTLALDEAGLRTVLWNAGNINHQDALKAIRERSVDGVVFTTATEESVELRAAIEREGVMVLINRYVDGLDCDSVTSDNLAGGAAVADYLVNSGRTRVAFIGGDINASTSRDRALGFLRRMTERGHEVPAGMCFSGDFSHAFSRATMARLLVGPERPRAVFCANDNMAFGALDALRAAGLGPEDCWVIGYDDVDMASWTSLSLTTVRQPSREMARAGVELLVRRIAEPERPTQLVEFPCELILRGSTGVHA